MKSPLWLMFCFILATVSIFAKGNDPDSAYAAVSMSKRQYAAVKINMAPKIDGILNDEVWNKIEAADNFTALEPVPFTKMSQVSQVKLAYDDKAIYVSAKLFDDPSLIRRDLSSRDQTNGNTDWFSVNFDCFNDDQNGTRFILTAAGIQGDARVGRFPQGDGDGFSNLDFTWDAIWESAVQIDKDGWNVEMRIPYMALRFPKSDNQTWGLQFSRHIHRTGETGSWQPIDPKVDGLVIQWGDLTGLKDIKPPLRLSLSPYIANTYSHTPYDDNGVTKFAGQNNISGGLDLKYGINESFTLDATLVPNFGQVQSDNRVLNLSPFEIKYDERRPFFTEGTDLFNKGDIFYSRRVGGTPLGFWNVADQLKSNEVIETNPAETQLYNATKISGRTNSKLGIGFFNAIAAPMYATIRNTETNELRKVQTSALTNYNVTALSQTLKNNSEISFTNANTMRNGNERDANVSALRVRLRDKGNKYEMAFGGRASLVHTLENGNSNGYTGDFTFQKVSGKWRWSLDEQIMTDKWDPNDLGIFNGNNMINHHAGLFLNEFKPKKFFIQYEAWLNANLSQRYRPFNFGEFNINNGFWGKFKNQSWANYFVMFSPANSYDFFESRYTGKIYQIAPYYFFGLNYHTDERKRIEFHFHQDFTHTYWQNGPQATGYRTFVRPSIKINKKLSVLASFMLQYNFNNRGYSTDNGENDIIFGRRDRTQVENNIDIRYNFNTKMNLSFHTRHYWSKVKYNEYYQLQSDGTLKHKDYTGNQNINLDYFNIDMVYTWQFSPGSFLNVIWKNNIQRYQSGLDILDNENYTQNLTRTWNSPQVNNLTLKVIYFLDYNKLRSTKNS